MAEETYNPTVESLERFTKLLPVTLTPEEIQAAGRELGRTVLDMADEEAQQDSMKKEMKARLGVLEAKRSELATKITRGTELREVEVEPQRDYGEAKYFEIRLDTGEVIKERPLSAEERQLGLPKPA